MVEVSSSTRRRTILQRGFFFLAGVVGLRAVEPRLSGSEGATPPPGATTLTLSGRCRQVHSHPGSEGRAAGGGRMVRHGELLDGRDGKKIGEFHSTCFCPELAFGVSPGAASSIELHTLQLDDGTLFGIADPAIGTGGHKVHAVLAGTGRYAGARGSYTALWGPGERGTDATVEFVLTLLA
jgi:hypothetical protein